MVAHTKPLVMSGIQDVMEKPIYVQPPTYIQVNFALLQSNLQKCHLLKLVRSLLDHSDLKRDQAELHTNLADQVLRLLLRHDLHHIIKHLNNEFYLYMSLNKLSVVLFQYAGSKMYTFQLCSFSN